VVMSQYPVSMSVPSSTTVPCSSMVTLHDAGCVVLLSALPCRAVHHQLLQISQSAGISDKSTQPPVTPPRQHIQHATRPKHQSLQQLSEMDMRLVAQHDHASCSMVRLGTASDSAVVCMELGTDERLQYLVSRTGCRKHWCPRLAATVLATRTRNSFGIFEPWPRQILCMYPCSRRTKTHVISPTTSCRRRLSG
jgi:hypothetical protein